MNKFFILIAAVSLLAFSGCQAQKQMQQQLVDLDTKVTDSQRKVNSMESELKKASFEIGQLKSVVSKLGEVVVNLQRAEEDRAKKTAESKSKGSKKKATAPAPKKKAEKAH